MADIIDLDFYRKFKVILPVYSPALPNDSSYEEEKNAVKPCRRRRKASSSLLSQRKRNEEDAR